MIAEPEVQKAALNVIINSVCGPTAKASINLSNRVPLNGSTKRRASMAATEEPLIKLWETVRSNNGIMVRHLTVSPLVDYGMLFLSYIREFYEAFCDSIDVFVCVLIRFICFLYVAHTE